VGFTAEYASGTITPEPGEIEKAAWFHKSDIPPFLESSALLAS